MAGIFRTPLAKSGSTGNNTHASVQAPAASCLIAVNFVVEVIGATPAITWKVQGTLDAQEVIDANATWLDLPYITAASDTLSQAAITANPAVVGSTPIWLDNSMVRFFRRYRLVASANVNVTYRADLVTQYRNT